MTSDRRKDPEFQYPFRQSLCEKHRLATRIWRGIEDQAKHTQHTETCQCCGRKVGLIEVEKNCKPNSSQFSFLGPGIPLFFKFVKCSAVLLVLFSLVFSIYGLYTNINSKNCEHNQNCVLTVFNSMSIVNKKDEFYLLRIQNYILLTFVLCCFILLHIFRYMFRKTENVIDKLNMSASDYSIIIKRLPHDVTKQGIRKMIENQISSRNFDLKTIEHQTGVKQKHISYKIESIVLSYDVTDFLTQKQNQIDGFKNSIKNNTVENFVFKQIPMPNQLGEIAIVVFSDQQTKDYFIYEPNFWQRLINYFFSAFPPLSDLRVDGKLVAIERAPQPEDILWQNAHITPWERTKRKILLNFASFIFLMMGGLCQYGLALWQTNIEEPTAKILIGTVASICVTVSNTILTTFLHYSTIWERMGTHSQYLQVLTFKLIIQQFLNAGVFVVGANVLADFTDSMLENSLADTITQIMILNAITPNLTAFFMNNFEVMGRINRFIFLRTGFFTITQLEANLLHELPKPDLTEKYSYIVKTLWLTAFYAPFVPIVVPISAIGLGMKYFIQKFLFSRSYSIASKISASLNRSCMQGLEYIPLIFSIGQFLIFIYFQTFFKEAPEDWMIPIYVCLGLSFLNLVLPMEQLSQKIEVCIKEFTPQIVSSQQIEKKLFQEAKEKFEITYEMTYPASKMGKGKKRDTFFKNLLQIKLADEKPSQSRVKLTSTEYHQIFPISQIEKNKQLQKQEIKQEDDSYLDFNIADTSGTPSLLKETTEPAIQQTQLLMVKKTTYQKQEVVKFSAISSTRPNDSDMGSVCEFPIRAMEIEPEPGKVVKGGDVREEVVNSLQGAKKLFQHYEKKKVSNRLIEIKQQLDEEEKDVVIQ